MVTLLTLPGGNAIDPLPQIEALPGRRIAVMYILLYAQIHLLLTLDMISNTVLRNRSVLIYGLSLALLLFLLKWLEWHFLVIDHATEIYAGCIAVMFTALGIWLALKLAKPKMQTVIVEKEVIIRTDRFTLDEKQLEATGLSKRELEVLQLMADGLSNEQIAERLFVSVNTVKTHSSKLFGKLDVTRRTHAIDKARKLSLIP